MWNILYMGTYHDLMFMGFRLILMGKEKCHIHNTNTPTSGTMCY